MKKFFDIVMPVKTAACYIFTATMCVYAVLDLVFGWGGLPDNYLFSFLLLSLAGGVLQIVAFTELVIKRLRYTLRLFVFAVPYLAVLSAIAAGFGWLPAAQPGAMGAVFPDFPGGASDNDAGVRIVLPHQRQKIRRPAGPVPRFPYTG